MTYTPGLEADERLHRTHHRKRRAPDGLAWRSMRKLRCVDGVRDGEKCVVVRAEDTAVRRRVARVCGVVDEMLNVAAEIRGVSGGNGGWVCVLYVCNARVSGFLLCECVGAAGIGMVRKDGSVRMTGKRLRKMLCGIQKMWVDETKRRSGIATRMVDVARTYLKYAHEYKRDEVAFTPVTSTGAHLASGYCGNEKVLIYGTRRDERKNGVGACDGKEKPENVSVSENV